MYTFILLYYRIMYKYVICIILGIILILIAYNVLLLRQKENIYQLVELIFKKIVFIN
jgi:hypothetical protein